MMVGRSSPAIASKPAPPPTGKKVPSGPHPDPLEHKTHLKDNGHLRHRKALLPSDWPARPRVLSNDGKHVSCLYVPAYATANYYILLDSLDGTRFRMFRAVRTANVLSNPSRCDLPHRKSNKKTLWFGRCNIRSMSVRLNAEPRFVLEKITANKSISRVREVVPKGVPTAYNRACITSTSLVR